ncbi:cytochrome-c peroxidase [Salipaludibacillus sp. LMS25]|jgi:cytochrome c peroxidase|uniref:cytochrome-c peroxidase n=1 Tax=Salipaludibacillus sp. LMS25 TaxID=2924031 RepID=UPI0020D0318C|nr:cytochrome c peroxidase [Salipaludibacillus sp. LMS25]UTR16607.1 cytochrome-c peroxidase [Salipaludibacillus sp. LMS25]
MFKHIALIATLSITSGLLLACGNTEDAATKEMNNSGIHETNGQSANSNGYEEHEPFSELIDMFEPLGDMEIPDDNPMTEETIALGKTLFFDPRLSGDNSLSCASCHIPALGYGDSKPVFEGFGGVEGPRNTPTIINSGYYTSLFWDGRAESLEAQALGPIESEIEMNQDLEKLVVQLSEIDDYVQMFEDAFNDDVTIENIGKALAAFQRTIVLDDTPFDAFIDGDYDALTEKEIKGMELFAGKALCITCHTGSNLSDDNFHNIGMETDDKGRYDVTGDEVDDGAFRTPGLYGIDHRGPYMHNGSIETLEDVIDYYDRGGDDHPNKSPLMQELNLTDDEKEALHAFLLALSGENPQVDVPSLPED